ncbi:hypothetical protein X943_002587 [Babesia divergens]|uniref:YGGT family protein n=1 Tax=Babesia divergens TaxID=32595 RepID=A0AAD9GFK3_BABDI|nr:hypothetical protein X943_002587 [Babesia divergens]
MKAFLSSFLLLQAACLLDAQCHRSRVTSLSFVVPSVHTNRSTFDYLSDRRTGIQTRVVRNSKLFASTPIAAKQMPQWERALLETWKEHGESIVLGTIYGIRIFRFILHVRNLLEWLPQANPYLFPFDAIYQTTNAYLKLFQTTVPSLYGVDVSSIVAVFVLDHIEALLAHKPGVAQEALR